MITPILEKLLLSNKAKFKTQTLGLQGGNLIQCKKNNTIVVVDFTWYHVINIDPNVIDDNMIVSDINALKYYQERRVSMIRFESKRNSDSFIIKADFSLNPTNSGGFSEPIAEVRGHVLFNTFLIHDEDIRIEINTSPRLGASAQGTNPFDRKCNFPEPPEGYGTESTPTDVPTTNRSFISDAAVDFLYFPQKYYTPAPGVANNYYTSLKIPFHPSTVLFPQSNIDNIWFYQPIVVVNYVEIFSNFENLEKLI